METLRYLESREHLPTDGLYRLVYSDIYHAYYIARFCPIQGWQSDEDKHIYSVTHWQEAPLHMPFIIENDFNKEKAKEYGINSD